jgi:hypothetical protein
LISYKLITIKNIEKGIEVSCIYTSPATALGGWQGSSIWRFLILWDPQSALAARRRAHTGNTNSVFVCKLVLSAGIS